MNLRRLTILLFGVFLISSCGDDDNAEPPAELVKFEPTKFLNYQWGNSTDDAIGQKYLLIEPLLLKEKIVTAGKQGVLNVYSLDKGKELAEIELDEALSGGVGGNENIWLVGTRNGELVAVNGKDHSILWRTRMPSEILARPIIYRNMAIVRTSDGQILGVNTTTGDVSWNYSQTIPALTLRGSSAPVIARNYIFTGLENGRLIALSPIDGKVAWDIALTVPQGRSEIQRIVDIDGQSVLYGRNLYATSYHGRMAAIDVTRGQFLWARPFSSNTGVSVDEDAVYSTDDRSHVWAIDRNNGATLWKQDKLQARSVTRPVIFKDYLVAGDYAGYLHVMSKSDGRFLARILVDEDGILVPPMVHNDRILVISRDGLLESYTLEDVVEYSFEEEADF